MTSKTADVVALFLGELLGTALLLFLGCMGCISWGKEPNNLQVVLTFGMVVMIIIQIFGCVSGAHLNPVVSIAAVVYGIINYQTACMYFIAQTLGAFMGFGLLKILTPPEIFDPSNGTTIGLCSTVPHPSLTEFQALSIEFLATTVLIFTVCGVWDPRNATCIDSLPLRFGFAITAIGSVAGPFTGASMNPVRTLGPAIWNGDFQTHWIYWVGPLSAGTIASVVYKSVFRRETSVEEHLVPTENKILFTHEEVPLKNRNLV